MPAIKRLQYQTHTYPVVNLPVVTASVTVVTGSPVFNNSIDFQDVASPVPLTPIVNTADRWWQNFATPPKAAPRSAEYLAFTYGAVPLDNTQLDKWYRPFVEPRKLSKDRATEFPAFTYGATPIVNTADRWWQNLATPPKAAPRVVEFPSFTIGQVPIVNTTDRWWQNLATPPKALPRTVEYPSFAFNPSPPETVTLDKWYRPLSDPKKLFKDRTIEFPAFTYGPKPIVNTADQWWQNLATPPKAAPRTIDYNASFTPPYQLTPSDFTVGWWRQLSEPYPSKRGLNTVHQQALAFVTGAALETVTMDKWYRPYADPRKLFKDLPTEFPSFAYGPTPIVSTPDRWWQNLATPPNAKPRDAWFQFTANFPIQPQARDQIAWWVPFTQPKRLSFGLPYQLQGSAFLTLALPFNVYTPYAIGYIIA